LHQILKVSRTLADLDGAAAIATDYRAEAISYHSSSARVNRHD
jgi:predicted ATPase with chaperone activity